MPIPRKTIALCLMTLAGACADTTSALAAPVLEPSTSPLELGSVEVDSGPAAQQGLFFSNSSPSAGTVVESIAIVGPDAADFSLPQDDCSGKTVEPMTLCATEVRFQPRSPGAKSATLELVESFGTVEVPLAGAGATGTLSANPTPLGFPLTVEGQSQTEQVTIDDANAATHIAGVTITGPDAAAFSVAYGDCTGGTFTQGNSCDVGVRFAPSAIGEAKAQLVITSDASGGPLVIPLSGTGAEGPIFSVSARQALLGEVLVGASVAQAFTVTNTGDYPLAIQKAFLITGTPLMFPVVSDACSGQVLEPGASCAITVDFQPSTAGPKTASILFISESSAGPTAVGIEGVGVAAGALGAPSTAQPMLTESLAASGSLSPTGAQGAPPRLVRLPTRLATRSVHTGIKALCPASATSCQVRSVLTTTHLRHRHCRACDAGMKSVVLLGSTASTLRGGESSTVNTLLSPGGAALVAHRHNLQASVTVAITAPGIPTVAQSRALTLNPTA